ncbi:hypothetical protein VI35_12680 [Aeromonas caviae]|nr:hypothetical protein VI35_12680 [Aeromonas caviae]
MQPSSYLIELPSGKYSRIYFVLVQSGTLIIVVKKCVSHFAETMKFCSITIFSFTMLLGHICQFLVET